MPPLFIISSLYEQWRQNCCAFIDTFLSVLNVHQEKNHHRFSSFERAFFLSVLYLQVAIIVRSAMCSAGVSFCGKWSLAGSPLMKLEDQLFALCGLSIMVSTSRWEHFIFRWGKCQAAFNCAVLLQIVSISNIIFPFVSSCLSFRHKTSSDQRLAEAYWEPDDALLV